MRKRSLLTIAGLALALGACADHAYDAVPVKSAEEPVKVGTPGWDDKEAIEKQDCFRIIHRTDGWSTEKHEVGVACMVDPYERSGDR